MSDKKKVGSVTYRQADDGYFENRGLRRYAGVWSLWALGVGAVISGDFFGWNFGLTSGGFGGLLYATVIIAVMYIGMCYSLAEMSPALPHTGGAYSFGRTAMGPWGGFITGLAENMEYVLTPAVIVVGIGGYMGAIFNDLFGVQIADPVWWLVSYAVFVGLNFWGVELTFKFSVFITFLALLILLVFWIGAIPLFHWDNLLTVAPDPGHGAWLPKGMMGIAYALPFAMWFYLAIEQLPLAAEESHDPARDMPKGLLYGILTLIIASVLTLFLNAGIAPGAAVVGKSSEPLFLAFKTIFGEGAGAALLALIAVAGLIASFHTIIYAYGRNIYSLSRAGYFPHWMSVTHSKRKTPHVALVLGAVVGYVVALIIQFGDKIFGGVPVGGVLLNMAVFGAVIAYVMQMISFVILRKKYPDIERPYVSPLGNGGAIVSALIAAITLVFLFFTPDYRPGIYGCAAWFGAGLVYFYFVGRHKLILSPEEEFAITGGHHGHPETEGYGHTAIE
ncbi:amino acid permease [Varunaivibrio sulfuroxidans]|uniref:Ethanolamine:proton symporter (EAT family) n=1 Tax=Varunaivibrio sulfuroxidans TaxID=1773489 RepID=A0A4V2UNV1_9PROT|nr:amino acid permease [Varunaivibrio sulfuroxidans]TCS63431.1 ethanolamine:proton symporter (EAT family) [Varunaivibrio sulfuroxidans]WES30423.1 amino acid permease [Varunaivibrio sulfuroxidans]